MSWLPRRIGVSILLIWAVISVVFLSIRIVPGDPAELFLSRSGVIPDRVTVAKLHEQLGLNQPALGRYFKEMGRLLRGDLGRSLRDGSSVSDEIALRLPRTVELIGVAALLATLIGIPGGVLAATPREGVFDRIITVLSASALATPAFVLGILLILLFAQALNWMPAGGYIAFAQDPLQHVALLAMPSAALGLGLAATMFRMTRGSVLDVTQRNFVRTARAKGLAPSHILLHHVLRNALIPIVAVLPLHVGALFGGAVLVEYLFNYPGLSCLLVEAVNARDYPVVEGVVMALSVLFITVNLLVDLLYSAVDPRARAE